MSTNGKNRWSEDQLGQARRVIQRISEYQSAAGLNDTQLLRQFPMLGSTRTWRQRCVAGKLDDLRPGKFLNQLRRIDVILDGGLPDAEFYAEMPFVKAMVQRLLLLEQQYSDRRILVVLAPNGCGKTTASHWMVIQNPSERAYCRMRPSWRNKLLHICNGVAKALGSDSEESNVAAAEERLVTLLKGQRRTLFLDQAHEGGPALMHLLRVLVDETPSRFVYLGYDTAYRKVLCANTDAMIEAQAFRGRCLKPVFDSYKHGILAGDVAVYLRRAIGYQPSVADGLANRLTPILQAHGNLRLLADATDAASAEMDDDDPNPETLVRHVMGMAGLDPKKTALIGAADEISQA